MRIGLTYTNETKITSEKLALSMGSGDLNVLATPAMIALMENAALEAVIGELSDSQTTVGVAIDVNHLRPTAAGEVIHATATLKSVDGRKLTFSVKAMDRQGVIGEGTHTRVVVDRDLFLSKLK